MSERESKQQERVLECALAAWLAWLVWLGVKAIGRQFAHYGQASRRGWETGDQETCR